MIDESDNDRSADGSAIKSQILDATLRMALDAAPVSIAIVGNNRRYIYGNKHFCDSYGIALSELTSTSSRILFSSDEEWADFGRAVYPKLHAGEVFDSELNLCRRDGSTYPCRVIGRYIDRENPDLGSIWVVQDISDKKNAEIYSAKETIIAGASHDIRQSVHALELFIYDILSSISDIGTNQPDIMRSLLDVKRLISIVSMHVSYIMELHASSSINTPNTKSYICANDILDDVSLAFSKKAEVHDMDLRIIKSTMMIKTDPKKIIRIACNLVDNAIKHAKSGRIVVGFRRRARGAELLVIDEGPGITHAEHQPDTQNPSSGLGLGLSVCKQIAENLDHAIGVRPNIRSGCTFFVVFDQSDVSF